MQAWEFAIAYHEETKHHYRRFARSAGAMDWANQPNPFRRYAGSELIGLAHSTADAGPTFGDLHRPGAIAPEAVTRESLSALFEYALALSAWKEFRGTRWALRINPSSGNLHPTEGYLACGPVAGLIDAPGVFHYAPKEHALERRARFSLDSWDRLGSGFPAGTFFVGLTSIHWREAWKYGERAYRYCQHDVGHALAAVSISAAIHGWAVWPLTELGDEDLANLLGISRDSDYEEAEREAPDLLVAVIPQSANNQALSATRNLSRHGLGDATWQGKANRLSAERLTWELIDAVEDACRKSISGDGTGIRTAEMGPEARDEPDMHRDVALRVKADFGNGPPEKENDEKRGTVDEATARRIIRQRRSAVAMDGRTSVSAPTFFHMMDRVMPRNGRAPWNALGPPVCVHLGLFVHRVEGVKPGLYVLVRDAGRQGELKAAMNADWEWERPDGCPPELPLFRLTCGDVRALATQVSCTQDIAGDGAFSCGMIAEFEGPLRERGAWFYRRLFWETGAIGQVLYLEAEAAGIRATGIGCFFDDPVHEVFGLRGRAWQSLYHFTVGGPVEDTRLTTLPAYADANS